VHAIHGMTGDPLEAVTKIHCQSNRQLQERSRPMAAVGARITALSGAVMRHDVERSMPSSLILSREFSDSRLGMLGETAAGDGTWTSSDIASL
jgi:hypothetical protein